MSAARRGFWAGFVLAAALAAGAWQLHVGTERVAQGAVLAELATRDSSIVELRRREAAALATADSLRAVATVSRARHAELASTFTIDTRLPLVTRTPSAEDTTRFTVVTRATDGRQFPVPFFFAAAYLAAVQAADDERALRVYTETYVVGMKDQLIKQLAEDRRVGWHQAAYWFARANPRCGTRCKLVAGAAGGLALRKVVVELVQ